MARLLSGASLRNLFISNLCLHHSTFSHSLLTNRNLCKIFISLSPFCVKRQHLEALNSFLIVHGLFEHQPLIIQFINQCCHLGFPDLALPAFKTIKRPSLSLQNLVLRSLCDEGLFGNLFTVYEICHGSGCLSDNYTHPFVIKACSALRDIVCGKMMHCLVIRDGFGENLVVKTALVDFYSKVGEMENACKLVDEISQPDIVAWNALISGFSFNSFDYKAFQVFRNMRVMAMRPNASTFASLFPVCSRVGDFDVGKCLHGLAYKLGISLEESLLPALISMYANCGDVLGARTIFVTSTCKNVIVWNAMMSAYARNDKPEKAFALFQSMLLDDMNPNAVTFVSLIPSIEHLGCILYVESFHAYIMRAGFEKQLSVATALLSVYAKLGSITSAEFIFHNVCQRNLLSWNSMISAYACNCFWEHSLNAFCDLQIDGFNPDAVSIVSILSLCSELEATLPGKSVHAYSLKMGIDLNLNVSNALLAFYCNCHELAHSFTIFNRMVLKGVVSWNTMISGCADNGESERAMLLFHQMRKEGLKFDLITLISILSSSKQSQNLMLGLAVHSYAIRTALAADISLANALVSMYINCGELEVGMLLFDDMPNKSVVSWNAILTGLRYHNFQKETLAFLNQMIKRDHKPNYVTLLNILPACCTLLQGKSIHAYMFRMRIPPETPLLTSLIIMYAKFERLTSFMMIFDMGDKRSMSLWNTVISAYLLSDNAAAAFSIFCELLRNEIEPDDITVLNLISACLLLQNLRITNSVLAFVLQKGFDKDIAISNSLIDLYGKCGSLSSARTLFELLPQKNTISCSIMINVYGLHGDGEAALALYLQMRILGLKPDKVTYVAILSACSRAGIVEQGRMVFNSMIHNGVFPGMEHYACMVDLLGRTGHLNEASEIVKNMLHKPSASLLESLLGACLSHGNYKLGEEIGKLLLEMNPNDPGPYVILYNIYAASGKWLDANSVRLIIEQKQFSKTPGFSLVDTNT